MAELNHDPEFVKAFASGDFDRYVEKAEEILARNEKLRRN
jgi:hypothetical protein